MTTTRTFIRLAGAVALAAAAAPPIAAQLRPGPKPGQSCSANAPEGGLPALAALADSAALSRALEPVAAAPGESTLLLAYDTAGRPRGAIFAHTQLADASRDSVQRAVWSQLRRQPVRVESAGTPHAHAADWMVELHVRGSGRADLSLRAVEECSLAVRNQDAVMNAARSEIAHAISSVHGRRVARVFAMVQVSVDAEGVPLSAELTDSTGIAAVDSLAPALAVRLRFYPATLAGLPVPYSIAVPFRFDGTPPTPGPVQVPVQRDSMMIGSWGTGTSHH